MAGYNDTRNLIIEALMGRQAGTEIQPAKHQAYALNMLDYVRSVELVSSSTLVGLAEESTVPVQPDQGKVCYIAGVGQDRTVTFSNFIDDEGNPISITTGEMEGVFVILLWNMEHWVAYTFNTNIISSAESANFYYGYNIRKTYASVAAMNADSVNPIGTDGRLIKIGELVTVVNSETPSENGYYSYEGSENGWLLQSGFSFEIVQTTGTDINKTMSQKAVTDNLELKIDKTSIKQVLGTSTTDVMSQKGVFNELNTEVLIEQVKGSNYKIGYIYGNGNIGESSVWRVYYWNCEQGDKFKITVSGYSGTSTGYKLFAIYSTDNAEQFNDSTAILVGEAITNGIHEITIDSDEARSLAISLQSGGFTVTVEKVSYTNNFSTLNTKIEGLGDDVKDSMLKSKDFAVNGNVVYDSNEIPLEYDVLWSDGTTGHLTNSSFNDDVFEYAVTTVTYNSQTIVYSKTYDENGYITNENITIN